MYKYENTHIPKERRAEINETILSLIRLNGDMQGITANDIFNGYTGIGGLHELNYKDFDSYHAYSAEKKEIENGQFFTPPPICEQMINLFPVTTNDTCADLSFGMGNFFNYLPNQSATYGTELDTNAYIVAKYLYPLANIENKDIRFYEPAVKFDYVFGNPPFNLKWKVGSTDWNSQNYYVEKAFESLKPMGILAMIIPDSYLADDLYYSNQIKKLNTQFTFLCQYSLSQTAFKQFGSEAFPTKVIIFAKASNHYESKPFVNEYVNLSEAQSIINSFFTDKAKLRVKLQSETLISTNKDFAYKVRKYLYEIKTHKVLQPYYANALAYVAKLREQKMPQWIAEIRDGETQSKEWNKVRVTENKVIAYLKQIMAHQHEKHVDKIEWVRTRYGLKQKAYSPKSQAQLNTYKSVKSISFNEAIINNLGIKHEIGINSYLQKKALYELIDMPFSSMERNSEIDTYLRNFSFKKVGENGFIDCRFNEIQFTDLGLIMQKPFAALNWSPGCGKTPAGYAWAKWNMEKAYLRNMFIVCPAVAANLTWKPFLEIQNENFILIESMRDISKIKVGQFVILSYERLVSSKKLLRKYIKSCAKKIGVIFDESDEMTNWHSARTKAAFCCFRDVKRKLLTTGTLTRNRISEYYPQAAIMYNNSVNMLCECRKAYFETKDLDGNYKITSYENDDYMQPFSARHGMSLFSDCFNPSKASVFGIRKQNQDIFNEPALRKLIEKSVITRRFKELVGDKYTVHNLNISQNEAERNVYHKIVHELHEVLPNHYSSIGNSRKDSMLKIKWQLDLLINATSMPHLISGYDCVDLPNKALKILSLIKKWETETVAIGCISLNAVNEYEKWITERFPQRKLFIIQGNVTFSNRKRIISDFEKSFNGILLCTQQSLRASVNIPFVNKVIVEAKQWNIPKMEQWYFRFIRYDSDKHTDVYIISYADTIEMNLLALLMAKERLNDYIKTLCLKGSEDVYGEFGVDFGILDAIMEKNKDKYGKTVMSWGSQTVN